MSYISTSNLSEALEMQYQMLRASRPESAAKIFNEKTYQVRTFGQNVVVKVKMICAQLMTARVGILLSDRSALLLPGRLIPTFSAVVELDKEDKEVWQVVSQYFKQAVDVEDRLEDEAKRAFEDQHIHIKVVKD